MTKSSKTREKILETSLRLFNENGPDNVSTVQIFKEMKISPGNLYYYYKNKEEIIYELYNQMILEYKQNWNIEDMEKPEYDSFTSVINNLRIFFKYRFIMNHMMALINNDPNLRLLIESNNSQRQKELKLYFKFLEESDIMDFKNQNNTIDQLVSVLWFLGDFWLIHLEQKEGKITALSRENELEYLI